MGVNIIIAILGGSAVAALINQIGGYLRQRSEQTHDDNAAEDKELRALRDGMRLILLDRIRYLGQAYLRQGQIDYDDRRILNAMHKAYHEDLGGNGDLDVLMRSVNALPLKP